jgi:hypothetical protein
MIKLILLISIFSISLLSFEVKFEDKYQKTVSISTNAFSLQSDEVIENIPFKYFKIDNKYIVIGDNEVDEWIRNSASLPLDTYIKEIKVGLLDINKLRVKIINRLNKNYEKCNLSKINFLDSPKEVYLKPETIEIKTKVILECR